VQAFYPPETSKLLSISLVAQVLVILYALISLALHLKEASKWLCALKELPSYVNYPPRRRFGTPYLRVPSLWQKSGQAGDCTHEI
jgi:hypothetical protein